MTTNFHIITVKYLGPTNSKGSRVKLISERFEDSKTIPYDYKYSNTYEIAEAYLSSNGYDLVGKAEGKDCYYIITNTFKGLKG